MSGYGGDGKDAMPKVAAEEKNVIGWHNLYWSEGQEKVCFRPGGKFFCAKDELQAEDGTWCIFDGDVLIDWKEYGRYVLSVHEGKHLKGFAIPKNEEDNKNWRKTIYAHSLTPVEEMLFGEGEGTEWEFEGPEGKFSAELRCDGHNHFICTTTGNAHWKLDKKGKTIIIEMGKHGKFELDIDVKTKSMDGYFIAVGVEDPDDDKDWRKAEFKKILTEPMVEHDDAGDPDDGGHGHSHGHSHGEGGHSHGEGHGSHEFGKGIVGLGNLTVASEKFMVDREGQVDKGFQTEFGVERVGAGKASPGAFKAWLQDSEGKPLCDPVDGESHDDHAHFHVTPKADGAEKFVISYNDVLSTISIHPGGAPANDGIMSVLEDADGKHVGFIELKLHDDAGDLELWLCKDPGMEEPFDIKAETTITITFPTHDNRSVQLNVRDMDQNPDEDDKPNMRDGMTNYFVFPGESDQDPEFLIGEKFRSTTTLTFTSDGKTYTAPPFILVPHQH